MTPKTRRKLLGIGVLLVPALLVKGTAFLLGNPVARLASAEQQINKIETPMITPLNKTELTPAQRSLVQHIAALGSRSFGPSPLYYAPTETGRPVESQTIHSADVQVQAVMGGLSGSKAVISGRIYQVGDKIRNSAWVIESIDAIARSITIRHETTSELETHFVRIPGLSD